MENKFTELLDVLKAMAQDRREQMAMFHEMMVAQHKQYTELLNRQAEAISDSEARIGHINTMVTSLFEIVSSKEKKEEDNTAIAKAALDNNKSLQGELHKLVALLEERSREEVVARKRLDEVLDKVLSAEHTSHPEQVINLNRK